MNFNFKKNILNKIIIIVFIFILPIITLAESGDGAFNPFGSSIEALELEQESEEAAANAEFFEDGYYDDESFEFDQASSNSSAEALEFDPVNYSAPGFDKNVNLSDASPLKITVYAVNIILTLLGTAFLIMIIYAGALWMGAQGNEETIEKAKDTLKRSVIGLAIVLLSASIAYIVYALIVNAATNTKFNPEITEEAESAIPEDWDPFNDY